VAKRVRPVIWLGWIWFEGVSMNRTFSIAAVVVLPVLLAVGACEAEKSSSPLSPAVAGPIAGVQITPVKLLEPAPSFKFRNSQQPIRLVIENATSNGARPLSYTFELASDAAFENKAFARSGVPPGEGGRTSVVVDKLEIGRDYHWRVRAEDGANTGPFVSARFEVLPTPTLSAPAGASPVNNAVVTDIRPTLRARNADRNSAVGELTYLFQIAKDQAFSLVAAEGTSTEGGAETSWTADRDLEFNTTYFWRVRAADSETTGSWSATQVFRSAGPSGGDPGPGPSPGPAPDPSCAPPYPRNGPAVVDCVERKYPQYLVAGVSLSKRQANMAFLRDRIIEIGICGGMNMGWNMKRGGPDKSIDFLAWHDGRQWIGVDIGRAYDATNRKLDLVWGIYGPTPHAATYSPRPSCN
jgi:hypothetical protein